MKSDKPKLINDKSKLIEVSITDIEEIRNFVADMNLLDFEVKLSNGSNYEVSAKSLMAILAFKNNKTYVYTDDDHYDTLFERVKHYMI